MPPTILIVDDSKLARIVAGKTVASLRPDWNRLEAPDAEAARALVAGGGVDVVLIDYNMPGTDGLELAAELRASHPTMPIALITANVQDEVVTRARDVGAGFVNKPVTADTLRPFLEAASLLLRTDSGPS